VTTNVPGPRFPLYLLGRTLTELYPYVPIGDNLRIGVAIFSYLDRFTFGITADYRAVPQADLDLLAHGIKRGIAGLKALRGGCGYLLPGPAGADAGRLLGNDVGARLGVVVADLDEDPAPLTCAGQRETAGELGAPQHE
jgi:hypothetical protein